MDIVEWLRDYYHMDSKRYSNVQIADEIERLREEVKAQKLALNHAGDAAFEMLKQDDEIERLREQESKMTNHAIERMEEIERLREALDKARCYCEAPCLQGKFCSSWIASSALQQKDSE